MLANCDALSIIPEDESSEVMLRTAPNVGIILREEAHLQKVNDPTAGAFALSAMMHRYCQEVWTQCAAGSESFELCLERAVARITRNAPATAAERPSYDTAEAWQTAEGIAVPSNFSPAQSPASLERFVAGVPPYLRGPYATMYVTKPWTVRQYAGFSTAKKSNAFIAQPRQRTNPPSIAFDLATHRDMILIILA